jgi:hypothetical protein
MGRFDEQLPNWTWWMYDVGGTAPGRMVALQITSPKHVQVSTFSTLDGSNSEWCRTLIAFPVIPGGISGSLAILRKSWGA